MGVLLLPSSTVMIWIWPGRFCAFLMLSLARAAAALIIVEAFFTRPGASLPWSVPNFIGAGIAPRGWLWLLYKRKETVIMGRLSASRHRGLYIAPPVVFKSNVFFLGLGEGAINLT